PLYRRRPGSTGSALVALTILGPLTFRSHRKRPADTVGSTFLYSFRAEAAQRGALPEFRSPPSTQAIVMGAIWGGRWRHWTNIRTVLSRSRPPRRRGPTLSTSFPRPVPVQRRSTKSF